jgi:CelD/BcsL family acetyltransferase involved in cellulose biosynthesis
MSHVEEINDVERLADRRLLWQALLARTPRPSFFQSLDWLTAFWRHVGDGSRLRVLVVHLAGEPAGILPLMVARESTWLGRLRVLTWPLDDWGPFYGPIGPWPAATLAAGLAHIQCTPRNWDLIDLDWLPTNGWDRGRTAGALRNAGLAPLNSAGEPVAVVDLVGGWETYWRSRSGRWRQRNRLSERRLAEHGQVTYLRHRPLGIARGDDDPRWDLYDACEQIASRSWQGSSTTGNTLSHAGVRSMLREVHVAATRAGAADLNLLLNDGRPVAFVYGYVWDREIFHLRTGYDAAATCDGAGSVLIGRMIQDSCLRGDRFLNLGAGYLEWKKNWSTAIERTGRCTAFANGSLRAQAIRAKRAGRGR